MNPSDVIQFLENRGLPIDSLDFLKQAMLNAKNYRNPLFRVEQQKQFA